MSRSDTASGPGCAALVAADPSGIQDAAKAASDPASSSSGKYLSLSTLASKYGATSSVAGLLGNRG
jgi:hypothetical protein